MALWPHWIKALQNFEPKLCIETPLIQLAKDKNTLNQMIAKAKKLKGQGIEILNEHQIKNFWEDSDQGGLLSRKDGRVDPLILQRALRKGISLLPVASISEEITKIKRQGSKQWLVSSQKGNTSHHNAVIICAGLQSQDLIKPLGYERILTPVLGQAIEIEIRNSIDFSNWPAVFVNQGFNMIPTGANRLLIGATLEHGKNANPNSLATMLSLHNSAPSWLIGAEIIHHWSGLRARPLNRMAPLLEVLEPGLILTSGHYRNGVLLAPATAEWVEKNLSHSTRL